MAKPTKWILLADDDPDIREAILTNMELKLGGDVKVITAENGLDASGKIPYQAFDCIITDLKMPKKEGGALIKSITQSPLNDKCPIVVITGEPDREIERNYKNIRQFEKPLEMDEFIRHIETQIKLGPTDQRLTASLINSFIQGVQSFISKTWATDAAVEQPFIKESSDPLNGEIFRTYKIKCGKKDSKFVIGFNKDFLETMAKKANVGNPDMSKISGALGAVVKKKIFSVGVPTGTEFADVGYGESIDSPVIALEKKMRGITIPLVADDHKVFMQIFW